MSIYTFSKTLSRQYYKQTGITLLELLVTLVIISILAVTSTLVYTKYVRRSRRSDAINTALTISLAEERFRSNNPVYAPIGPVWGPGLNVTPGGYYNIFITNMTATGYRITLNALGDQANDEASGMPCSSLIFTMDNGTVTKDPPECWQ